MIDKPLSKRNTAELEAELDLYRSFDDIEVPAADSEELSNNGKRAAVIEALRAEHGYAWKLTQEDIESNPAFADVADIKVDDVLLLDAEEWEAALKAEEGPVAGEEYTFVLTEADLAAHEVLGATGFKAGDEFTGTVLADEDLPAEVVAQYEAFVTAKKAEAEAPAADVVAGPAAPEVSGTDSARVKGTAPQRTVRTPVDATADLVYLGKTVIQHRTKIVHGKSYKEVDVGTETYTITSEEFERDVQPREVA